MFLKQAILRLRAAHGLAFAMAAGQRPDPVDLHAAGLRGIAADFFVDRIEGEEARRTDTPRATATQPRVTIARIGSTTREAA